jgi:hypothetical protein
MSADGLFHIDEHGALAAMTETPYAAEDVLPALLERHPDLLAGGQMTPGDPRRWALIAREHGVPDRDEAAGTRWSIDHLFVDQDAVPTLVEVKRSTDTRIRREVVGQLPGLRRERRPVLEVLTEADFKPNAHLVARDARLNRPAAQPARAYTVVQAALGSYRCPTVRQGRRLHW